MTLSTPFPSLTPNAISLDHGRPQVSEYQAFGIGPIRFRHDNFISQQNVAFTYTGLDQTSLESLRDHYQENYGTTARFTVPISLFGGLNIFTNASEFRYADTFQEEHIGAKLYNVTVTLLAVKGLDASFTLDGGPAALPSEFPFNFAVFDGTAPFILNGSSSSLATVICNAD
tara:strand:+ start:33 stop:548 length:516 start_codon:yes stop_codon:yes gene_type:complete